MKLVACQLTPPHRINVWRLAVHPLVILVVPAIKMDAKESVDHTLHRGHADEPGLHQVHCFHLHACLEAVVWAVLSAEKMKKRKPKAIAPSPNPPLATSTLEQACLQLKASRERTSPQSHNRMNQSRNRRGHTWKDPRPAVSLVNLSPALRNKILT